MSVAAVLYIHSPGGSLLSQQFVWRVPDDFCVEAALSENQNVIEKLKRNLPIYHSRAMRKEFVNTYGRFTNSTKPFVLRSIYRELTGDASGASTSNEAAIDKRLKEALSCEDIDIIVDLREANEGRGGKYDIFWTKCKEYLQECTAVPDRRHGDISFMAKAISTRDLITQVSQKCPEGCAIPSEKWVNLNFCPRNPRAKSSCHYSGRLEARRMVQKRLFRKSHPDEHYCAALFRYQREFAVKYQHLTKFICIDDKHRVKIGEPGFPVAAAERGREVVVSLHETFAVGDHDFTRFSIIPSVVFDANIPNTFEGSWYTGKVLVGLKDAVFEASSPLRHATELHSLMLTRMDLKSILCVYSDGGPDHRLTYILVQLSLIALYLNLDLDFLIACRTAPNHSWRNPVERLMSIINLGFQSVGLMRSKLSDDFELKIKNCHSLKELRTTCISSQKDVSESLQPAINLLKSIIHRLQLKGEKFDTYDAADENEIESFWEILEQVDETLTSSDTTKKAIKNKKNFLHFIDHCCQVSHYSFQVKKCGKPDCTTCKPVRMDPVVFDSLHFLPNPVPGLDDHYKSFEEVYGQSDALSDKHRPSLQQKKKKKATSFSPSQQHAKNTGVLLQCEDCDKWRLLFCKHKLSVQEVSDLQSILDDVSYTCGTTFEDLDLPGRLTNVFVKDHSCGDSVEKLYYSCGYELICVHCASEEVTDSVDSDFLPQCQECEHMERICRPKKKT